LVGAAGPSRTVTWMASPGTTPIGPLVQDIITQFQFIDDFFPKRTRQPARLPHLQR
jgi:hypothetical protein